jgi:CRP/FNR family transcriptional regulator, cyclic AMP receptor protein
VAPSTTIEIFRTAENTLRFEAGAAIFSEGDTGDRLYVVREGTVALSSGGELLEEVGPGGVFGELALIDSSPRSGTATAVTACDLVALDERAFLFHVSQTPFFALNVMRVLAERLRRASAS